MRHTCFLLGVGVGPFSLQILLFLVLILWVVGVADSDAAAVFFLAEEAMGAFLAVFGVSATLFDCLVRDGFAAAECPVEVVA